MKEAFDAFRVTFSERFMKEMEQRVQRFQRVSKLDFYDSAFDQLLQILRGGKRIRPYLLQLGFGAVAKVGDEGGEAVGGGRSEEREEAMMIAGMAIECFHAFCLVHDDIMDRSDMRRSMVTVHEFVRRRLETYARVGDTKHSGYSQAILMGDLLHAWSNELFGQVSVRDNRLLAEHQLLVDEVMMGQMMDVDFTTNGAVGLDEVERKYILKTASYTFARPVRIGLLVGGASDELVERYSGPMLRLGSAFQLQDDYLDIFGATSATGKGEMRDIEEGQQTFFTAFVRERANEVDRNWFNERVGKPVVGFEDEIRALLVRVGAEEEARVRVARELDIVEHEIREFVPSNLQDWLDLVHYLSSRTH